VVYSGPVDKMSDYYARRGFPVPENTNLADHALFAIALTSEEKLDSSGLYMRVPVKGASVLHMELDEKADPHELSTSFDADPEEEGGGEPDEEKGEGARKRKPAPMQPSHLGDDYTIRKGASHPFKSSFWTQLQVSADSPRASPTPLTRTPSRSG
jgi:hypothetical protein